MLPAGIIAGAVLTSKWGWKPTLFVTGLLAAILVSTSAGHFPAGAIVGTLLTAKWGWKPAMIAAGLVLTTQALGLAFLPEVGAGPASVDPG